MKRNERQRLEAEARALWNLMNRLFFFDAQNKLWVSRVTAELDHRFKNDKKGVGYKGRVVITEQAAKEAMLESMR